MRSVCFKHTQWMPGALAEATTVSEIPSDAADPGHRALACYALPRHPVHGIVHREYSSKPHDLPFLCVLLHHLFTHVHCYCSSSISAVTAVAISHMHVPIPVPTSTSDLHFIIMTYIPALVPPARATYPSQRHPAPPGTAPVRCFGWRRPPARQTP